MEQIKHNDCAVQMKGITKVYPNGIAANQSVDFSVYRGEIHALMGENGAGKSTLMKMLFGLEQPTEGEIYVDGEKVSLTSPTNAISYGIGMVHQHFMLVPSLTVAENIVLGMVPKKTGLFLDYKKAVELTKEYAEKFNLVVNPDAKVMDIPVGMKQKVEILKALIRGARILILDEPTAVLTTQETTELFKELLNLKEQGYTIIFISHKLKEIKQLTDRLTIMRAAKRWACLTRRIFPSRRFRVSWSAATSCSRLKRARRSRRTWCCAWITCAIRTSGTSVCSTACRLPCGAAKYSA